jgi:disulfide bond formation protein DsbB
MNQQYSAMARWLAFLLPLALMSGALISQYGFGLYPCEMCMWQRWPHYSAIVIALAAILLAGSGRLALGNILTVLAALAILLSGLIGGFHAGVEYGWWEGVTSCAAEARTGLSSEETLDAILNAPLIRCDVTPWDLFGISLAGFNFLLSVGGTITILLMMMKAKGKR